MEYYFKLQFRMLNRQMTDFGIHPIVGYLLSIAGFTGGSMILFSKTVYGVYILLILAIAGMIKLSESNRNSFLNYCFAKKR